MKYACVSQVPQSNDHIMHTHQQFDIAELFVTIHCNLVNGCMFLTQLFRILLLFVADQKSEFESL